MSVERCFIVDFGVLHTQPIWQDKQSLRPKSLFSANLINPLAQSSRVWAPRKAVANREETRLYSKGFPCWFTLVSTCSLPPSIALFTVKTRARPVTKQSQQLEGQQTSTTYVGAVASILPLQLTVLHYCMHFWACISTLGHRFPVNTQS